MFKTFAATFAALVTLQFVPQAAQARAMESRDAVIVRHATPGVVNISTWKVSPATKPGGEPRRLKFYASGFIVDTSGIIVTNKHVIDGAIEVIVQFADGDRAPARLLAAAAMVDLAVLKVDVGHPLPALKWDDSDALQVGDPVLTIGNPLGIGLSVSAGIVSGLNRDLQDSPFDSYIQTDATINHGNSGGPLIDHDGSVAGVDTALYNPEENGGFIGIGFAIPSNTAKFVVGHLLDPAHPKPGWLGFTLQDMTEELSLAFGLPHSTGAIIASVDPTGPASRAFLRPGDVLEAINGMELDDSRAFMRAILMIPVGSPAFLTVWRDAAKQEITATVAEWPNYMPYGGMMNARAAQAMIAKEPDPGVRLAPITDAVRKQYGLDPALSGALVTAVVAGSEAGDLGIKPGDVITAAQGQPVASPGDVGRAVRTAHAEHRPYLAVLVQSKNTARWISLSISGAES